MFTHVRSLVDAVFTVLEEYVAKAPRKVVTAVIDLAESLLSSSKTTTGS